MATSPVTLESNWPLRTWVLAILGAGCAVAMQQLGELPDHGWDWGRRLVAAAIVFLGAGGISFGLAWLRGRLIGAIIIALVCALITSGVILWNNMPKAALEPDSWHLVCGVLASIVLLTLFQAGQDRAAARPASWAPSGLWAWKRDAILYPDVHGHLWTNALLIGLSGMFVGLVFLITGLFSEMFWLVKLDFLRVLMRKEWFDALLAGTALGGALGLLRDRGAIISALQRVAMLVLRVLAPVVAIAIFIFLAALPFTGLAPLWKTGGTTPIMLVGAGLALFLANAVVSDAVEDESRSIILSSSAAALGLFLIPMVGIAAFSSGLRIQQYGLSPDRLWALTFIIVASITAIAYAVTIIGKRGWFSRLRATNLDLLFLLALIALLLSTPLLGFERIATAQQLARLAGGQVSAEAFDYKALWFDYGPSGRAAINRMAASSSDKLIRRYASQTRKLENRWDEPVNAGSKETGDPLMARLTILPRPVPIDEAMRNRLIRFDACGYASDRCTLRYVPGQDYMIVMRGPSAKCDRCEETATLIRRKGAGWDDDSMYVGQGDKAAAIVAAVKAGKVAMKPVTQRQLFVDGKPVGYPFTPDNASEPTQNTAAP